MASTALRLEAMIKVERPIEQVAHEFSVGNVLRLNSSTYVEAQADSETNAAVVGIVSSVLDVDNFYLTQCGYITGLAGLTAGAVYYLSESSAGDLTATKPTGAGEYVVPCFIADSTTSGYFLSDNSAAITSYAPDDATYILQVADADLSNAQALGALATGMVKNTTATGVLSIGVEGTDYLGTPSIGVSVQAYDAGLESIAGLTTAADKMIYTTALDTYAVTDLSSLARSLLDDSTQATMAGTILSGASLTAATVAASDLVLLQDVDDADNLKTATAQAIANLAGGGTGGAPTDATYIVQTANGTLTNEQALAALATGIVKNTTTTGVLSIAAEGTDYYGPGGTDIPVTDGGTGASNSTDARTNLGLVIGTDVQAYDAGLASIAGLTTAADTMIYTTASDTYATTTLTSLARSLLDDSTQATMAGTILSGASLTSATVATGDLVLVQDVDDSNNLKTATAQSIADLGGGGGLVLLATASASASATIDFDNYLDSTYDAYFFTVSAAQPATSGATMSVRIGTGATPTYQTGTDYLYANLGIGADGTARNTGLTGASVIRMSLLASTISTSQQCNSSGYIYAPSLSNPACIKYDSCYYGSAGTAINLNGMGSYNSATAITSIRFFYDSGNTTSGEFSLYGIKNT